MTFKFFSAICLSRNPIYFSVRSLFVVSAIFLSYNLSKSLICPIASFSLVFKLFSIISSNLIFSSLILFSLMICSISSVLKLSSLFYLSSLYDAFISIMAFEKDYFIDFIASSYFLCFPSKERIFFFSIPTN